MHIALCVTGEMGHYMPMMRLADAFEGFGHKITIISNYYMKDRAIKMA